MAITEGLLTVNNEKFCIVVSRFNEFISSKLLSGAIDELKRHGVNENNIDVVWCPGAFEIPVIAKIQLSDLHRIFFIINLKYIFVAGQFISLHADFHVSEPAGAKLRKGTAKHENCPHQTSTFSMHLLSFHNQETTIRKRKYLTCL